MKTARAEKKYPQAPIAAAAMPFPTDAKRALRPNRSLMAAWPTRPRLIAAMAGPRIQLAIAWVTAAGRMTANAGCAAYAKALAQMAVTPMPATKRSERAASTNAPPGIWPINDTRAAAE